MRLQVFIPLASTTLVLSAAFAVIVIDRFTARASLFALRAAEDEARVVAELAAGALDAPGTTLAQAAQSLQRTRVLQAFTRSAIDTDVAILDAQGRGLLESGEADSSGARRSATAPLLSGGRGVGAGRARQAPLRGGHPRDDRAP